MNVSSRTAHEKCMKSELFFFSRRTTRMVMITSSPRQTTLAPALKQNVGMSRPRGKQGEDEFGASDDRARRPKLTHVSQRHVSWSAELDEPELHKSTAVIESSALRKESIKMGTLTCTVNVKVNFEIVACVIHQTIF